MKKLFCILTIILLYSIVCFAQVKNLPCPEISMKVSHPDIANAGDTVFFSAVVDKELRSQKYEYEWSVDYEIAFGGQGTSMISVVTNKDSEGTNIFATVKVKGLPANCKNTATDTIVVLQPPTNCGFFPHGKVSLEEELARFDNYLVTLQNNPDAKGYVLFEIKKDESLWLVKNRISSIFKHIKWRKFDIDRISFDACQSEDHQTTLAVVPRSTEYPKPEKCERIDID